MADDEEFPSVVIDNSSYRMKFGMGGNDTPTVEFRTVVGTKSNGEYLVGEAAIVGCTNLSFPLNAGSVSNWDDMVRIWDHGFKETGVNPKEHPILFMDHPLTSPSTREKTAETLFKIFEVPALHIASHPLMAMWGYSSATGLLVDIGDSATVVSPVRDGAVMFDCVVSLDIGGQQITRYLTQLLHESGYTDLNDDQGVITELKEQYCQISQNYDTDTLRGINVTLNNKQVIHLNSKCVLCPEVLFRPSLINSSSPGLHECINKAIMKCPIVARTEFFNKIYISGGSSMFSGIRERLVSEVQKLNPAVVYASRLAPDRKTLAWVGGSIESSLSYFHSRCVSREEYLEKGSAIIRERFPKPEIETLTEETPVETDYQTLVFDIGTCKARVGYCTDAEPKALYSAVTLTNARHGGVYANDVEFVGEKAFEKVLDDWFQVEFAVECQDPTTLYHLAVWGHAAADGTNPIDDPSYYSKSTNLYAVADEQYANKLSLEFCSVFTRDECMATMEDGIYIDLGHKQTTFYEVEGNKVNKIKFDYGGHDVSVLLARLLETKERSNYYRLPAISGTVIKDRHCKVALNLKESLQELGYTNILDNIENAASEKDSYLNKLTHYTINEIQKMCLKDMESNVNLLAKQGWKSLETTKQVTGKISGVLDNEYVIDWERYIVMESLFNRKYIANKDKPLLIDEIRGLVGGHHLRNVTLMGGMVACPGFVERVKMELADLTDIKWKVDENLMWKCAVKLVNAANNTSI